MKSRKELHLPKRDIKIDKTIHDLIKLYREKGLIKESIQDFVTNTVSDKLDILGHKFHDEIMRDKLNEVIAEIGKMSLRITNAEKKTHTRSRKTKHKK